MSLDFDPSVDYYKALGVDAKASTDDIKKAYRKLAKQYHPDSTGGDKAKESRFKEASAAYDVLGDAKKRAQYDEIRAMGGGRGVRMGVSKVQTTLLPPTLIWTVSRPETLMYLVPLSPLSPRPAPPDAT